jgi:hypothetical protein
VFSFYHLKLIRLMLCTDAFVKMVGGIMKGTNAFGSFSILLCSI